MSDYTRIQRLLIAAVSFVIFAALGAVVRFFIDTVPLDDIDRIFEEFTPIMLIFGIPAAILAYLFPSFFSKLLSIIPLPGG